MKRRIHVTAAYVEDRSVMLVLSNGTTVERDFSLVCGGVLDRLWRRGRLNPRVRIQQGALAWPNEIDFELDLILWGYPRRGSRPVRRAFVGCNGGLIPAPLVKDL